MRFANKIVLVVGGNSGIGLSAAQGFAAEGATVVITGRDQATLDAAVAGMADATAHRADVADPASLDPVIAAVREAHGRIDVLFVNAGIGAFAPVREVTPELWDQVHDVNLRGCFFAVQKALPLIGRGGSIVITGSIGAVLGVPGNAIYAAAKAGLRAVARILATELVGEGIRVNVVSPGPTETPIIHRNVGMDAAAVDSLRQVMIAAVPMKRMGEPSEIARAVLFLASDEASFITGVDLFVDGGCVEL
ncbi:MAG: putative oxidoreductase [Sphingomonas bacterium]|nr:putative oxidoreductase [Sphingomonas bacterium]MDB5718474.1 putative oxidoreductase [Sphingomonas bacterium]